MLFACGHELPCAVNYVSPVNSLHTSTCTHAHLRLESTKKLWSDGSIMATDEAVYQPKDAISTSIKSTMITGAAGAFVSGVQNTLTKQNVTAWGIFTRTGGTIAVFGTL